MRAGGGREGEEDWLLQVVLVTVKKAYYTPSIARIFSKLCFAFSVLKIKLLFLKLCFSKKKRKTSPNYTFIVITFFILGYILALKKTQSTTAPNSRLETETPCICQHHVSLRHHFVAYKTGTGIEGHGGGCRELTTINFGCRIVIIIDENQLTAWCILSYSCHRSLTCMVITAGG